LKVDKVVERVSALKSLENMEDPKSSGDVYVCLSSGAKVTTKVLNAAWSGECVHEFDGLCPSVRAV
jgi:hypothetical protein